MIKFLANKIIGTQNQRELKRYGEIVIKINALEEKISVLSDEQLRNKTEEFKSIIGNNFKSLDLKIANLEREFEESSPQERQKIKVQLKTMRSQVFDSILPEAFAVVREVAKRKIHMRHFDVQLMGGLVLHEGKIAEMVTGEGKTLVATLSAYLNALLGKGVHIVTVNDYLARRDRDWMGPVFEALGLTIGVIQHDMPADERKLAYGCDIVYGTNNEFGFDYLRDNMVIDKREMVQRSFYYAIVDEVDSILIDEARTPLIISGPTEASTDIYFKAKDIASTLKGKRVTQKEEIDAKYAGRDLYEGVDYIADEKANTVSLSDEAEAKVSSMFGISSIHDIDTIEYRHQIMAALKAKEFFQCDVDYVVKNGQVIIVDEFTGRLMPGRRWSDGLHQAIEAKEGLKIEKENQTLATITLQNYFRMYEKLSGMTGTAFTEAGEFKHIYDLDVIVVPTNQPLIRANYPDAVYKSEKEKFEAVVEEIVQLYNAGRPVLVGTISIEKSEFIAAMLTQRGITHNILNAKYHEREAYIIAQAGRFKAVTIATNMAGRGTDILLGGNAEFMAKAIVEQSGISIDDVSFEKVYKEKLKELKITIDEEHQKVIEVGGLHIIGTERHEARRIDNQLRGRSGRQGDPGSSRFYVSLQDDLMRLFGSDRLVGLMDKLGLEDGQVIEHPWVTRSIEMAQRRVEGHNFEIRKHLLEYDNVMNKQREIIYHQRKMVLGGTNIKEQIAEFRNECLDTEFNCLASEETQDSVSQEKIANWLSLEFNIAIDANIFKGLNKDQQKERIKKLMDDAYIEKEKLLGEDARFLERMIMLQIIDSKWKDHLYAMDYLREGIGLRSYGQKDPLIEYQREAFNGFQEMIYSIKREIIQTLFKVNRAKEKRIKSVFERINQQFVHEQVSGLVNPKQDSPKPEKKKSSETFKRSSKKVGRNDPCPCGSGKKYKKCCGK
ncbi:MAG: preprotein translocase subunit SecA [Candidatus Gygaella obscura]|nr:preprotein translocase subunit SecA [Candidatus Gygaella obscura]